MVHLKLTDVNWRSAFVMSGDKAVRAELGFEVLGEQQCDHSVLQPLMQ